MPLHAEVRWATQGTLVFDVTSIDRRTDVAMQDLATPPATASFVATPLPKPPGEPLLSKGDLAAFRTAPLELPPPGARDAQALPPDSGLVLVNGSDLLRVAWLDGVDVAWVAPGGSLPLTTLIRGRYTLQWRTALGDAWEPPQTILVPGRGEIGTTDAVAR